MAVKRSRPVSSLPKEPKYRVERDSIGTFRVLENASYGIGTARARLYLGFSNRILGVHIYYLRALVKVKKAAAHANRDAGVITPAVATAIEAACDDILQLKHSDDFPADVLGGGGGIAVNMNVNEVIANVANESLGGARGTYRPIDPKLHVNASQSTADVCHTAMRIAIIEEWDNLHRMLGDCIRAMRSKAGEFREVRTLARTCLQDASVTSLGELFGGYTAAIARRTGELDRAVSMLHKVNLGGTVIGDGSGAPPAYRRAVLGHLKRILKLKLTLRENLFDAAQNCDDLGAVAAQLGLLAEVLIKVANDLRLLSSGPEGGFGEISLPAVMEGSSFYPGKINPVIPETLMQCCFQVLGFERATRGALEHGELNLNVFEGSAASNLMFAMGMLTRSVESFTGSCLARITVNKARCRKLASTGRRRTH